MRCLRFLGGCCDAGFFFGMAFSVCSNSLHDVVFDQEGVNEVTARAVWHGWKTS